MVEFNPLNNSLIKRLQNIHTNLPQHKQGLIPLKEQTLSIKAPLEKDVFFGWKKDTNTWPQDSNKWPIDSNVWPLNSNKWAQDTNVHSHK